MGLGEMGLGEMGGHRSGSGHRLWINFPLDIYGVMAPLSRTLNFLMTFFNIHEFALHADHINHDADIKI